MSELVSNLSGYIEAIEEIFVEQTKGVCELDLGGKRFDRSSKSVRQLLRLWYVSEKATKYRAENLLGEGGSRQRRASIGFLP